MNWPIDCPYGIDGHHEPTVTGNPYSAMTYYLCRNCGKRWERGVGAFYGCTPPKDQSITARLTRIEALLKGEKE